jgi:sulfatase modifying factor 1
MGNLEGESVLARTKKNDGKDKDKTAKTEIKEDKDSFTNSVGMKFKRIPKGKFEMGSEKDEKDAYDDEKPSHTVEITKDFYLGMTEVTQGQWKAVMGKDNNPSYFSKTGDGKDSVKGLDTDDFPVEAVSWKDTQDFLKKLNALAAERKFKVEYRLPSEAEWEYACRGGPRSSSKPFHFKSPSASLGAGQANFDASVPYGGGKKGEESERTNTAGKNGEANALGLYDMHGNVHEWCSDWYSADYYGKSPLKDPTGPSEGSNRVIRGGGWDHDGRNCRSANRRRGTPGFRFNDVGFRAAAVPAE